MGREIDEAWIEEAIERYRRMETARAEFEKALASVDVTVRSPDGLVEIVVTADGTIRDVAISDSASGRPARELSRAVQAAITAAADAAGWARTKLHQDMFGSYGDLGSRSGGFSGDLGSRSGGFSGDLGSRSGGFSGDLGSGYSGHPNDRRSDG
jgi:DNA-binding protein YbaB